MSLDEFRQARDATCVRARLREEIAFALDRRP
jgi:hypothetical protein